jgi:hypothetical protein
MWVIYRNPRNCYTHLDKNVYGVVEDKDILEFQKKLAETLGKPAEELIPTLPYLQLFVGDYFARHYVPMTQYTDMPVPQERPVVETMRVSLFRDVELPSPCSNGQ